VSYAVVRDLIEEFGRDDIPILKIGTPFPLPEELVWEFLARCKKVMVLEETDSLLEYLIGDRSRVLGRESGHVPREGELVPELILKVINAALVELGLEPLVIEEEATFPVQKLNLPLRKPRLCPGCPHRPVFYAIRRSNPKGIFTSDIGCYTLGLNLGAVDTCLDMGAAITMAAGFYHAHRMDQVDRPIIATIGDSTFFHSGTAGLLNSVYNDARFVLVILDNEITAMTGMQPTPGLGIKADGTKGKRIPLEDLIKGCGVEYLEVVDSYNLPELVSLLKEAHEFTKREDGGIAAIIARHPCVIAYRKEA
ncbi:MAG: thiamine pyrophosphate-dependent enzyme, partial [Desulfatiglandales bacterium]